MNKKFLGFTQIKKVVEKALLLSLSFISFNSFCQFSEKISFEGIFSEFSKCAISKDASFLVFSGGKHFTGNSEEKVVLIDLNKREKVSSYKYERTYKARSVTFSDDNSKIACNLYDDLGQQTYYKIVIWDRYSGKVICEKKTNKFTNILLFSPDSKYLAFDDEDKKIQIIDASSGKNYDKINLDIDDKYMYSSGKYVFSPDWKYIAQISNDNTIAIWDVKNKVVERNITCEGCIIDKINYSDDGKNILCLTKKTIRILDSKNGSMIFGKQVPELDYNYYYKFLSFFNISKSNNLLLYQIQKEGKRENNNKFINTIYFYSFIKKSLVDSISGYFEYAYFNNNDDKAILVNINEICIYSISKFTDEKQITAYDKAVKGTIIDCNSYLTMYPKGDYVAEVKNEMIKKEKTAYDKAIAGNDNDCNSYLFQFPNGKYLFEVKNEKSRKEKVVYEKANNGSIVDCNSYLAIYPNGKYIVEIKNYKSEKELYEKTKGGNLADCNNYISKYPYGKFVDEVKSNINNKDLATYQKTKEGNVSDCNSYISQFPNGKYVLEVTKLKTEKLLYEKGKDGTISDCNNYLSQYPNGQYSTEINQLIAKRQQEIKNAELQRLQELKIAKENTAFEKAKNGTISDCNAYLATYPNGNYVSQISNYKIQKQDEINRNNQLATNSNKANWKMGNKLCKETSSGIICGTLNQWNENKSMAQIKIVTSPGGTYEGESLTKGNLIWVTATGKGWHICFDDEITNSGANDKSNINTASNNNSTNITSSKYDVGDFVYFCQSSHDHSGWMFMRRDFTAMIKGVIEELNSNRTKAKVKVVKCYECSSLGTFNGQSVYEGSEIWVDIYGWSKSPCNTR